MKIIDGLWAQGFALDKHTVSSTDLGDDDNGHPQFDTKRTDIGEALFQLKYRGGWQYVPALADALAKQIQATLPRFDVIVPMPASAVRPRQPVTELATEVSRILGIRMDGALLQKTATSQLKDLTNRSDKDAVLADAFSVRDAGLADGPVDVLLIDDLIHTGASLDAACAALRTSHRIGRIYVAVLTWR